MSHAGFIDDACILFFAVNGWGDPIECKHWPDHGDKICGRTDIAGVSEEDGSPLCEKHIKGHGEIGHRLMPKVLEEIKRRRLEFYRERVARRLQKGRSHERDMQMFR